MLILNMGGRWGRRGRKRLITPGWDVLIPHPSPFRHFINLKKKHLPRGTCRGREKTKNGSFWYTPPKSPLAETKEGAPSNRSYAVEILAAQTKEKAVALTTTLF